MQLLKRLAEKRPDSNALGSAIKALDEKLKDVRDLTVPDAARAAPR